MSFEARGEDIIYTTRPPYARRWDGKGKLKPSRWHTSDARETIIIDHVIEATALEEVTPPRLTEIRKSTDFK